MHELNLILEAARWAPTAHNMQNFQVLIVDRKSSLDDLANVPVNVSEAFLRESYEQLAFSSAKL
jgi:nitroreductase